MEPEVIDVEATEIANYTESDVQAMQRFADGEHAIPVNGVEVDTAALQKIEEAQHIHGPECQHEHGGEAAPQEPPKCPKCGIEVKEGTFSVVKLPKKVKMQGRKHHPMIALCECGMDLGIAGFSPVADRSRTPAKNAETKARNRRKLVAKSRKANRPK